MHDTGLSKKRFLAFPTMPSRVICSHTQHTV